MAARPVKGSHRVWLLGEHGPLDEPRGHFRDKEEAKKFLRGRKAWIVWEPALDGPVTWTYKK